MSGDNKPATNMKVVKDFFFPGVPAKEFLVEWKALSKKDQEELAEGIRNGSLDY